MRSFQYASLLALAAVNVLAQDWHFVAFVTPDGQEFISQSGEMVVPAIHEAATNYLWPGLQTTDNSGVYQNVLDGRSGTWWFGTGWCCSNPSLPWGSGFSAYEGDVLNFNNTRNADRTAWITTINKNCDEASATTSFDIAWKTMNDAVFAAELYGAWDFGPVVFQNVQLIATGWDTGFCTAWPWNYNDATSVSVDGVTATQGDGTVTCNIEKITLWGPK